MELFEDKNVILLILTILSVVAGVGIGFLVKYTVKINKEQVYYISIPGELLIRMLKMIIVPLIISSLIRGISTLEISSSGKMGFYTMLYYMATTVFAIILGVVLVVSIHPGNPLLKSDTSITNKRKTEDIKALDTLLDLLRNIFPTNLFDATFRQTKTNYITQEIAYYENNTKFYKNVTTRVLDYYDSPNIIGLITFSIVFGLILAQMGPDADIIIEFFEVINEIIMEIVKLIMWYSPIGIFFLITAKILETKEILKAISSLGFYILTISLGLILHGGIVLNLIFLIFARKNPLWYFCGMLQTIFTTLGTASSSAALPITCKCLEENNGVDKRVTRFILPIGATINMDGTALYEAVSAIFIAQTNGINLSIVQIFIISAFRNHKANWETTSDGDARNNNYITRAKL